MAMNQAKNDQRATQKTLLNRVRLAWPWCTRPMSENLGNSSIIPVAFTLAITVVIKLFNMDYLTSIILKKMLQRRVAV